MLLDQKNQFCENEYTIQRNLEIQYNPFQITNGIFHRTRTKHVTICMETKKTEQSKESYGRKAEVEKSIFLTLDYITRLQ